MNMEKKEQTKTCLQSRNVVLLSKYVTKNPGPTITKPGENDRSGGKSLNVSSAFYFELYFELHILRVISGGPYLDDKLQKGWLWKGHPNSDSF